MHAIAKRHAAVVPESVLAARADLFEDASSDFAGLLAGNLVTLPLSIGGDGPRNSLRAYFDHQAAAGDIERMVGFLNRFRLKQRIRTLHAQLGQH